MTATPASRDTREAVMCPPAFPEQYDTVPPPAEADTGLDPVAVLRTIAALHAAELDIRATLPRVPPLIRAHRRSGHGF